MVMGSNKEEGRNKQLDVQGGGQSYGVPADGEVEGNAYNPQGGVGVNHWEAAFIGEDGLDERGNVFFAAVEMTRMPMVVTNPRLPDNPIVFANNAFVDLTGYQRQDFLGRNCRFLQGPETDRRAVAELKQAVTEQRAVSLDLLNYKADGTPFWNALFIGPVFDKDGTLLYFFSSQMDITERRTSLETTLQAQKMEAIGQLTAGMAHDFNNLLQVINGNLELAVIGLGNQDAARAALDRAQRAAMRAGRLTQQLLTFARKQHLEPREVNINSLVVEFSDMLVRTLGERVDLRLDLRPGLPACLLDPTHLEMALLNVLINARDAMPDGGVVTVATSMSNEPATVTLCVIDNGTGMAPEVLRRATEPFFTTKGPGTGLGLAMVHGFVQQSHGRLEIHSTPDQGTTVSMTFPVADRIVAGAADGDEAGAQAGPNAAAGRASVLVVEDNDDVRELADSVLGMAGYAVKTAASGEDALEILEQGAPVDLLFTDVIMPGGMNGLQLIDRARRLRPRLPVLVTTGYMDELPGRPAGDGPAILPKPYRHEDLLDRVKAALGTA